MSKPIDSRSVSKWTITLDEDRRPWQLVKRREEWANVDTGLRISVGGGDSPTRDVILRATVAWDFDESDAVMKLLCWARICTNGGWYQKEPRPKTTTLNIC